MYGILFFLRGRGWTGGLLPCATHPQHHQWLAFDQGRPPQLQQRLYISSATGFFSVLQRGLLHALRRPSMPVSDLLERLTSELDTEMLEALEMEYGPMEPE